MTYDPVDSRVYRLEDELNRLAGTMVAGMPTVGKATAALKWLGHRELAWASHNLLTPNQATGGKSLGTAEGFHPIDGQTIEVVDGISLLGDQRLQITTHAAQARAVHPDLLASAIAFDGPMATTAPVQPWHYYTASVYTLRSPGGETPVRGNHMHLIWYDENDDELGMTSGDHHATKQSWNLSWVTGVAPEGAATVRVIIEWILGAGEIVWLDKAILYNGQDPEAWAFPGAGGLDLDAGLRAHLNMKAGIFNPDDFLDLDDVCNQLAHTQEAEGAVALSRIPTPDLNVMAH